MQGRLLLWAAVSFSIGWGVVSGQINYLQGILLGVGLILGSTLVKESWDRANVQRDSEKEIRRR